MKGRWGAGLLILLIGFGFLAMGGLFTINEPLAESWQAWRMRDWQPAKATLVALELDRNHRRGEVRHTLKARYRYVVDGVAYEGTQVTLHDPTDSEGGYATVMHQRLKEHQRRKRPIDIWVNPQDPGEAIVDREPRIMLLAFKWGLGLLFTLLGAALSLAAMRPGPEPPPTAPKAAAVDPAHPVALRANGLMRRDWLVGAVLALMSWPLLVQVERELATGNDLALIALVFPIVGALFLYNAARRTLEWRRFGALVLRLDPSPGVIGGDVGGTLDLPLKYDPRQRFEVRLSCIGESGGEDNWVTTLWSRSGDAKVAPTLRGTRLSFRFEVPDHLPASSPTAEPPLHRWVLAFRADLPGIDLAREYDVLVHRPEQPLPERRHHAVPETGGEAPPPRERVRVTETQGGLLIRSPAFAHPVSALASLALLLLTGAPAVFLASLDIGSFLAVFAWAGEAVFGLIALLMAITLLSELLVSIESRVGAGGLAVTKRLLGVPVFTLRADAAQVSRVAVDRGARVQAGHRESVRWRITAHLGSRKRLLIADGIRGKAAAEELRTMIEAALAERT